MTTTNNPIRNVPTKLDLSSLPVVDETSIYDAKLMVEKASGNYIWFEHDPVPYFDLIMGYSSTNFGHNNPHIIKCVENALKRSDNIPAFNFRERASLSKKLLDFFPSGGAGYQVYYPVGGAKSVDTALKLAMLYKQSTDIISFSGSFHGYSLQTTAVTDQRFFNDQYKIFQNQIICLDFPDVIKGMNYKKTISKLEDTLKNTGIAAVIIEPIQGASGFRQADQKFFKELRRVTREHDVILIIDEIQTGVGRTGNFYAFSKFGIEPDIVLLGKSLAGGFYPLGAIIARREYFDKIGDRGSGFDSTFSNNIFGITIADGVMDYMQTNKILDKVKGQSIPFKQSMQKLTDKYSFIKNISIVGLACAWEITDKATARAIKKKAFENHLIIQTAGTEGNYIKIAPALTITDEDLMSVFERLDAVLAQVL